MREHSRQIGRAERLSDTFRRAVHLSDPLKWMIYMKERKNCLKKQNEKLKEEMNKDILYMKFNHEMKWITFYFFLVKIHILLKWEC